MDESIDRCFRINGGDGASELSFCYRNRLYGVFTQRYCNYGQENRKCQSPQSGVNFEQRARRTTGNKTRESRERHPNTTPSQGHFLRQGITAQYSRKVDCQLDSIRGEYRGRREACQIEFDKRVLSGHRCHPEHPHSSRYCASGIGEGTKHSGKRQKSSQQYSLENQQCSQSPMLLFVFGYPNNYPQYSDENRNCDQRSDPTKATRDVMGSEDDYVSRYVRGKQSSECKESNNIDRARRHAQNGHKQPVECVLRRLLKRKLIFCCHDAIKPEARVRNNWTMVSPILWWRSRW